MPTPREILVQNRRDAMAFVSRMGTRRTSGLLEAAEQDLVARLGSIRSTAMTFTRANLESALAQVREVLGGVRAGMRTTILEGADQAAELATRGTIDYLGRVDSQFRGVGTQPLALDEASMFQRAQVGARASILRRLASSGGTVPGAPAEEHRAKPGILDRYGMNVIGEFEQQMSIGIIARNSWDEVKAKLLGASSFLRGKPGSWAERIVRTEMMGAYNRGGWEANRDADDQLGDMVKILSATFDDRTASDSYAVHGQIRRPDEAFESWFGLYQHPPNRPNDREIVVPHRMSWPLPPYLVQKKDEEVEQRWIQEKRKGSPPPRPLMSTVLVSEFGKAKPPKVRDEERSTRPRVPPEE